MSKFEKIYFNEQTEQEFEYFLDAFTDMFVEKAKTLTTEKANRIFNDYKNSIKKFTAKRDEAQAREKEANRLIKKYEGLIAETEGKQAQNVLEYLNSFGIDLKIGQDIFYFVITKKQVECTKCKGRGRLYETINGIEYEARCTDCIYGKKTENIGHKIINSKVKEIAAVFMLREESITAMSMFGWQDGWGFDKETITDNNNKKHKRKNIYLTNEEATDAALKAIIEEEQREKEKGRVNNVN